MSNETEKPKRETVAARFSPKHLPALERLLNGEAEFDPFGRFEGLQIEPDGEKGVRLVAVTAAVCVVVHDPDGWASAPFVLSVSEDLGRACLAPVVPEVLDGNGDEFDVDAPGWMTPGHVVVIADAEDLRESRWQVKDGHRLSTVIVEAAGPLPGESGEGRPLLFTGGGAMHGRSQVIKRKLRPWRDVMPQGDPVPAEGISLCMTYLRRLSLFGDFGRFRFYGAEKPVVVEFGDAPEVSAMVMPMKRVAATAAADEVSAEAGRN